MSPSPPSPPSLPSPPSPLSVLAANTDKFRTAAIRPGHIYGPGDVMISIVLGLVRDGKVPVKIGHGINDYVYVV
jgi:hypothetical protein